jgi:hypothetical protein
LERIDLQRDAGHKEAAASYSIVITKEGERQLQIDTYGSEDRADKTPGHRRQSLRFSAEGIAQLKKILAGI